jgi:cobalt-zinc-cadmium efflux system protein
MAHHHDHGPANFGRAFAIGVTLNLGFVLLELFYGSVSHSLALIGDAAHNFSDVFALVLAWGASVLVQRRATLHYTYGMRRTSIFAALINAVLLTVTGGLAWETIRRFSQPDAVSGQTMMWVAAVGIVVNTLTALLFLSGRKQDLNLRAAFLHMVADAVVAAGVVVSGGLILLTGWSWLDPLVSLVIAIVLLVGTWGLLRESVNLALDAVPEGIDTLKVQEYLRRLPGVQSVHDLHIWGMSTTEVALTAHLVMNEAGSDAFLAQTAHELHDTFGIEHSTLQVETGDPSHPCQNCEPLTALASSTVYMPR